MVRVVVFAEGQTEEKFIKQLVAPAFWPSMIYLEPRLLKTSQNSKGGAVSFERLKFYVSNTLKETNAPTLATFLDLYALDTDFPAYAEVRSMTGLYQKVHRLETALSQAIVEQVGCQPHRFIPHIQPHEFEGLLFSDVAALCATEPGWRSQQSELTDIYHQFQNPEHINGEYESRPSMRLERILRPKYKKTRHGPLAAEQVTLEVMEQQCPHFRGWLERLRSLV
ncbi:MAG: DUF4276 family protein [Magnetococcales bacterium]|nr:DUF4276 family protein [Magnetococcales bacterium]